MTALLDREKVTLTLNGHVPSHKNLWKRGRGGHSYIPEEVRDQLNWLIFQAAQQWRTRPAVVHPEMSIQLYVATRRQDRDNMSQTVIDCLRHAGVLVDDNIAKFNGALTILPAVIDPEEHVVVEITPGEEVKPVRRARKK